MTRDVKLTYAPREFTVEVRGLKAKGAKVSAYDPIGNKTVPVKVAATGPDKVKLGLTAADYPYLLIVEEAR
jgi:hypothetical protein